jgi:hypothetical protein
MSDDGTAEKAWQAWQVEILDYRHTLDAHACFMAGRASRDAEVAEWRAQVASDDRVMDLITERAMKAESALAEAQATIEKAATVLTASHEYHEPDDDAWWAEHYDTIITQAISILSAPSSTGGSESQGVALIAAERKRQVTEEGYDAEHDKGHAADLALAASSYALAGADDLDGLDYVANDSFDPPADWPWRTSEWKPTGKAIPDLVKAGGLIAAALDSLIAEGGNDHE